jgi:hypothetical protein
VWLCKLKALSSTPPIPSERKKEKEKEKSRRQPLLGKKLILSYLTNLKKLLLQFVFPYNYFPLTCDLLFQRECQAA